MLEYTEEKIDGWNRLGMRKAFGVMMLELAKQNPNVVILVADVLSSAGLKDFEKELPEQIFNIGIAEQNMVAIAAGLAKEGKNVYVVSFAPFLALRAYEAIRTLVGGMHLNVKVIALASGMSLSTQGLTHYCLEDIAMMRLVPNMLLISPADCTEMAASLEFLVDYNGPAYLRLTGIDGGMSVHKDKVIFTEKIIDQLREGNDVAILSTGSITSECLRAARALDKKGVSCSVYNVCCLKPISNDLLKSVLSYRIIVTVEEHFASGGLGGIIGEYLASLNKAPVLLKIGIGEEFPSGDSYKRLLEKNGLAAQLLRDKIFEYYSNIIKEEGF